MINLDNIFNVAIEKNASDIHLVAGKKPMLRVARILTEIENEEVLKEEDMYEMYDYFVRGAIDRDEIPLDAIINKSVNLHYAFVSHHTSDIYFKTGFTGHI